MNKKIVSIIIFVSLFCLASSAFGQVTIPNYGPTSFCALFQGIFTAVAGLVGAVGTIMIIVAGIFYLTSAGSPTRMEVAKKTLIYAIAGIAIALAAGAIVGIVITAINATGGQCNII